ncbi:hypothetical protein [Devosia epidermidihirudinis]|uniref:hypothetical protein n=1 Tax=Devosia epidermidihirudinis TaxID=1293439 RepID=UPI000698036C|nr:hypothetical protein [Devosia epidermidihirudinis]
MTTTPLSPEAVAILRSLINNPHHVEDSSALRELLDRRYAMGVAKVHATTSGDIYLAKLAAQTTPEPLAAPAKPDLTGQPW